jgi:transketolase
MNLVNPVNIRIWSKLGARGSFGAALLAAAESDPKIVALSADLCTTSGLNHFRAKYPDRFYNTGIAEQNLVGMAAGLASEGLIPFASSFSNFIALRGCEPVRHFLGYMQSNVKLVGLSAGFAMGMFGNTHYGVEDIAVIRAMARIVILSPADSTEVVKATEAAARWPGPVYLRLTGAMNNPLVYKADYNFEIGKAIALSEGADVAIIATGTMVYQSLKAAAVLAQQGVAAGVLNMHTIRPLDTGAIDQACARAKLLVSVEEHGISGGLGGAIAEYKAARKSAPPLLILGAANSFCKAGDYQYMLSENGLLPAQIAQSVLNQYALL